MAENLWQKYCSFLDKDFESQVLWNKNYMNEYLGDWEKTKMARLLYPHGVKSIEDISLTKYSDYPVMHEFGARMDELVKQIPREKGENYCDYYDKLSSRLKKMVDGWLADRYSFCAKTSGTTGESKWIIYGETFWNNMVRSIMATIIMCCSDARGQTSFNKGDLQLGIGAPAPYLGGYVSKLFGIEGVRMLPPTPIVDEEPDFMKKVSLSLKYAKKAKKIAIIAGTGAMLKLISLYFTNKAELFRGTYETLKPGLKKIILWFMWKYEQAFGIKLNKLKDMINPKGVLLGSFDTELYLDYIKDQLELEPINLYGSTESGFPFYGRPEKKSALFPDLQTGFFEFLDRNGNIKKINELEKGEVYEFVFTPFRSIVIRYRTGDLFKAVNFQKDGLPVFSFESRAVNILDINNYFRLSMSLAFKAFKSAGFPPSPNWAFTKELEPKERLLLLMEKETDMSAKQVSNKIFTEKKIQEGVPMGRIKPFRIISPGNKDIINFLRSA